MRTTIIRFDVCALLSSQKSFCVQDTLEKLPDALRSKVMLELHKSLILKIPFFAQCEDIFIDALANLLWLEVSISMPN